MSDGLDSVVTLARAWREALERYDGPRCIPGCPCPMRQAIEAVALFVGIVEGFEQGELIPGGLPWDHSDESGSA